MEHLKKSKIALWLIELCRVRPIVVAAVMIITMDYLYVNYIFKPPVLAEDGVNITVTGKIREVTTDKDGCVKTLRIGHTLCYVNTAECSRIRPGNRVIVKGTLSYFDSPMNPGEFDMKKYYMSKKVWQCCYATEVKVEAECRDTLRSVCFSLKERIADCVMKNCPLEGGTINTLLLADKRNLSEDRKNIYQKAGVSHFLVISGVLNLIFGL